MVTCHPLRRRLICYAFSAARVRRRRRVRAAGAAAGGVVALWQLAGAQMAIKNPSSACSVWFYLLARNSKTDIAVNPIDRIKAPEA
jgi:hypothetical protein